MLFPLRRLGLPEGSDRDAIERLERAIGRARLVAKMVAAAAGSDAENKAEKAQLLEGIGRRSGIRTPDQRIKSHLSKSSQSTAVDRKSASLLG